MRIGPWIFWLMAMVLSGLPAAAMETSVGKLRITQMAQGLDQPWSIGFLPGSDVLVTEREGVLRRLGRDGKLHNIRGVPRVVAQGQGGLLDILVPQDFSKTRQIFLSFAKKQGRGTGTALGVGKLSKDMTRLTGFKVIFEMSSGSRGGRHFGGRILEAPDGTLFLTIGERGERPSAQDLNRHNGSVVRIRRDGTVPADNPFVGVAGAQPEIWSYGHRNPQGAALDRKGQLWLNEHGAKGGDEVNLVKKAANYGWPVIAYGRHYSGGKIGKGTHNLGMEQPKHYWDPSIAPSGMMIYSGKLWPQWKGDFFIGSLKFGYIARLDPSAGFAQEKLQSKQTGRVRDIREAPDGSIWFLSVLDGAVYRIQPDAQ